MKLFRDYTHVKLPGSVVTIGNFDGVHLGHQSLIAQTCNLATQLKVPSVLLSFEPLPFSHFHPTAMHQIMPLRTKYRILKQWPLDYLGLLRFNAAFANMPPEAFVKNCLIDALGTRALVVGDDFRFGHQQAGDVAMLVDLSQVYGFEVVLQPEILNHQDRVSSSTIREALTRGDIAKVNTLLGYPFSLIARVCKGKQLGRTLGFPTANLAIHPKFLLLNGVYVCQVMLGEKIYQAVCNIGYQPTVRSFRKKVEVHILDFEENLYGQEIKVTFLEKLRNEKKFENITALVAQIKHDIIRAQGFFSESEAFED